MPQSRFKGPLLWTGRTPTAAVYQSRRFGDDDVEAADHLSLRIVRPQNVVNRVQITAVPSQIPLAVGFAKALARTVQSGDHETLNAIFRQAANHAPAAADDTTAEVIVRTAARRRDESDGGGVGKDGGVR